MHITLCTTEKMFRKTLRHIGVKKAHRPLFTVNSWSDAAVHTFDMPGKKVAVVCLRKRSGIDHVQVLSLLVHEATHLWQSIRENIGELQPSSEFEAYAIQSLSQVLMAEYLRQARRAEG
ncbi:hypothetical protein [Zoogloea sp.]|uniref:hypothetical protein n=1 Tax=Zoogloea sp. TaxID=49181 RepID=UPI002620297C|nr:hypothetical protein [Zoogloea sp.]